MKSIVKVFKIYNMEIKQGWKGIGLSLISALSLSFVYIFSKAALNTMSLWQFGFYWFLIAFLENSLLFFLYGLHKKFFYLSKREIYLILLIAFFELLGTMAFFASIKLYKNPTVVSFLANILPITVGVLSYIFLKERFNFFELFGIIITILGAMIIGYQSTVLKEIEKIGLGLLMVFTFVILFSVNTILIRISVRNSNPLIISFFRTLFLFIFSTFMIFYQHESLMISWNGMKNIIIGASLGPVFGVLTSFWALKYVEAAISSTIINAKGFLIMVLAYFYLLIIPESYQIYGGLLAVLGLAIMSYGKHLKIKSLSEK